MSHSSGWVLSLEAVNEFTLLASNNKFVLFVFFFSLVIRFLLFVFCFFLYWSSSFGAFRTKKKLRGIRLMLSVLDMEELRNIPPSVFIQIKRKKTKMDPILIYKLQYFPPSPVILVSHFICKIALWPVFDFFFIALVAQVHAALKTKQAAINNANFKDKSPRLRSFQSFNATKLADLTKTSLYCTLTFLLGPHKASFSSKLKFYTRSK